jgi:hypothetical protein
MLGMDILWWGRMGKIASVIGALAVLAEVAGPARLADLGTYLRFGRTHIRQLHHFPMMFMRSFMREGREKSQEQPAVVTSVAILIAYMLLVFASWPAMRLESVAFSIAYIVVGFVAVYLMALLAISVLAFMLSVLAFLFDKVCIGPLVHILARRRAAKRIQAYGLLVSMVGFHFDLLSS